MNKNLKKRVGIVALSLIGGIAFSGGVTAMQKAEAEGAFENAQIQMLTGASVRYYASNATTAESGIRFSSVISTSEYEALEALEATEGVKVSYGMLIAPYSYFDEYGQFNEATVFGVGGEKKYTWEGDTAENASDCEKIAHVTYEELIASKQKGYEAYHELKGSLIKIKDANLTEEFVGRGYIKYEYEGGEQYKFAAYEDDDVMNNVRSIVYVSQLAIDAGDEAAQWVNDNYVSKVAGSDGAYTLETYVGKTLVKSEVREEGVKIDQVLTGIQAAEYQGFELVSADTSGKVYANGRLTLKHVYEEEQDSVYQVKNGGFETGDLTNWTLVGQIGAVSADSNYWVGDGLNPDGFPFGKDGEYMFSSYAVSGGDEHTGTLQSNAFTVSENGWLTFKLGAMKNTPFTYVEIVDSATNEVYKRYGNTQFTDAEVDGVKLGCKMYAYKANLADLKGKSVYIRVSDYAKSDYGVVFADAFDALHIVEPGNEFALATELGFSKNVYELYNGNFANDLDGWVKYGEIGVINSNTTYWNEKLPYNNEGKFFSAYATDGASNDGLEHNTGSLKSGLFTVGGSGWITYRIGGVKNPDQVYMEVIEATTGERLGLFYNELLNNCTMVNYKADLSAFIGKTVYINLVDNATGDYGLIFCDEFKTYYETAASVPDYNLAVNYKYNVLNGSFETGTLSGWTLVDGQQPGFLTDKNCYWTNSALEFNKKGNWLYTGVEVEGHGHVEGNTGTLRSNTFLVKPNSTLTFRFGGAIWNGAYRTDVYVRLVKEDGTEIGKYYNKNGYTTDNKMCCMIEYSYDLNNAEEMACYIEICDYATKEWGLLAVDAFSVTQKA